MFFLEGVENLSESPSLFVTVLLRLEEISQPYKGGIEALYCLFYFMLQVEWFPTLHQSRPQAVKAQRILRRLPSSSSSSLQQS